MSKSIKIAALGLAAFGAVVAPVAGAGAASTGGPYTDTIDVTIDNACTFSRAATAHTDGDGDPAVGKWGSDTAADKLSGNLAAGAIDSNYGTSHFNVVCNNAAGWKVTATAGPLKGLTTASEEIPLGTPATDTAAWNYTSSSSDTAITGTGTFSTASQIVATSAVTTPTAGRDFKVQYAVSVDHVLSAQTYEGTIVYTFNQL